jgi:hypothetical protein
MQSSWYFNCRVGNVRQNSLESLKSGRVDVEYSLRVQVAVVSAYIGTNIVKGPISKIKRL